MTTPQDTAATLIDGAVSDGGSSVWLTEERTHGYLVGVAGRTLTLSLDTLTMRPVASQGMVRAWVDAVPQEIASTVGSWLNTENGVVYFDTSCHYASLDAALNVARDTGEIAVWDIANNSEVRA